MVLGVGTFGEWLGHESGTLTDEISALIKETPGSSLPLLAICKLKEGSHQNLTILALDLRFPDSRSMSNKFLLFISQPV